MKKIVFLLLLIIFQVSFSFAQACGSSVRKIELQFDEKVKQPKKVSYEMFYLAPRGKTVAELWDRTTTEFVSGFYHGDPQKEERQFWRTGDSTTEFLIVPKEKAQKYLQTYKQEDFQIIYQNEYRQHHLQQLKGEFQTNKLELKTGEMDNTPFLMKVSAKGFATQYFLSNFLGGCHRLSKQTIKMKSLTK